MPRTSKVKTMEDAERELNEREGIRSMKQDRKLEEIPGYEEMLKKYYAWIKLRAEKSDVVNKPLRFYHSDAATAKAHDINQAFGMSVATVPPPVKIGPRYEYRIVLDETGIKATFKDIMNEQGKLLESQKGIAA